MLSAPYYPIQNALPSNARKRDFGDGRRGPQIDGNNADGPTGITQRICLSQGESRSIRSSVLIRSDLVLDAAKHHGVGFDVKCLIRNGDSLTPLVTWTNAPFDGNDPANLNKDQHADWTLISAVVYIPHDVPVEFIDCTWGVWGVSGQVDFASASLRNLYMDRFVTSIGGATWTTFDRQLINIGSQGHTAWAEIRYLDAYAVKVQKNEEISVHLEGQFDSVVFRDLAAVVMRMHVMMGLKMRRKDGGYDYWGTQIARISSSDTVVVDQPVDITTSFTASSPYTQFEPMIYGLIDNGSDEYSSRTLQHSGLKITVLTKDVTAGGGDEG